MLAQSVASTLLAASRVLLNTHTTRVHGGKGRRVCIDFDPAVYGTWGMPICRWCGHAFKLWTGLRTHLQRGSCPEMPTSETPFTSMSSVPAQGSMQTTSVPLVKQPEVVRQVQLHGWQGLLRLESVVRSVSNVCPLCSKWTVDSGGLKRHLSRQHCEWRELWPKVVQQTRILRHILTKPCAFCKQHNIDLQAHLTLFAVSSASAAWAGVLNKSWTSSTLPRPPRHGGHGGGHASSTTQGGLHGCQDPESGQQATAPQEQQGPGQGQNAVCGHEGGRLRPPTRGWTPS